MSSSEVSRNRSFLEKSWVNARRDNRFYIANKVVSVFLSTFLAAWTLSYKMEVWEYTYVHSNPIDYNYTIFYWVLFLFYSFQALDELTELYTVMAEREKGALGLLFEMNYFLGVGVACYAIYIVHWAGIQPSTDPNHSYD